MKKIVAIIGLLLSQYAYALDEWHVAVINDTDGFVLVRSGEGKKFPVIDTLHEGFFFYCSGDTGKSWIMVHNPIGKTGFVHRSRVLYFYRIEPARQHQLLLETFQRTQKINDSYWYKIHQADKQTADKLKREHNNDYEGRYSPGYYAFQKQFCKNPDSTLLVAFFKTLPLLTGSADEGKDGASAKCWLCHPEFVENIVCHWRDEYERQIIISSIETGMAMSNYEAPFTPAQLKKKYASLEKKCN